MNALRRGYYDLRAIAGVFREDITCSINISLKDRLNLLLRGYSRDKYELYDFQNNCFDDYLPDWVRSRTRFINGKYSFVFNNKILSEQVLSKYVRVPQTYGWIQKGIVTQITSEMNCHTGIDFILKLLEVNAKLVLKPIDAAGGEGVKVLKKDYKCLIVNNKSMSKENFEKLISSLDEYMITAFIEQGEYSKKLFSESTNTLRILTMIDPDNHEPFIAMAVQRIGNKLTKPVDNFQGGKGGLNSKINIDTGVLGKAATFSEASKLTWYTHHPDTNIQIEGMSVPNWESVKAKILDVVRNIPYLVYVGWDVVVTDEDIVVIEVNNHCGYRALQVHEPLLKDPRVKKFYEYYKII